MYIVYKCTMYKSDPKNVHTYTSLFIEMYICILDLYICLYDYFLKNKNIIFLLFRI